MTKRNWKRVTINGLIVILVVAGLAVLAQVLVNSFTVVELLKRFHGG